MFQWLRADNQQGLAQVTRHFGQMLEDGRHIFDAACNTFLGGTEPAVVADDLAQSFDAEMSEVVAHLGGEEAKQDLHLIGCAGEFGAQVLILGGDAHRTSVEVALPHHFAAHCQQRECPKAKPFGAQQSRHHYVASSAHAAVSLQHNSLSLSVGNQGMVRLGDAELPRGPSVLDRH